MKTSAEESEGKLYRARMSGGSGSWARICAFVSNTLRIACKNQSEETPWLSGYIGYNTSLGSSVPSANNVSCTVLGAIGDLSMAGFARYIFAPTPATRPLPFAGHPS